MRYNPDTERGLKLEDVADYRTLPAPAPGSRVWDCTNGGWVDIPASPVASMNPSNWSGKMLRASLAAERAGLDESRTWQAYLSLSHAIVVAEAFGDYPEVRRLRAQLIADRY